MFSEKNTCNLLPQCAPAPKTTYLGRPNPKWHWILILIGVSAVHKKSESFKQPSIRTGEMTRTSLAVTRKSHRCSELSSIHSCEQIALDSGECYHLSIPCCAVAFLIGNNISQFACWKIKNEKNQIFIKPAAIRLSV